MKVLENDGFFSSALVDKINSGLMAANALIVPDADTGEIIIDYRFEGGTKFKCAYRATFDGGAGKSCAEQKIDTLIAHPSVKCTGHLADSNLWGGEVRWYGSNRLHGRVHVDESVSPDGYCAVEFLVAFSDREEWQDEVFVASVYQVLLLNDLVFIERENEGLSADPVVGTARRIIRNACY